MSKKRDLSDDTFDHKSDDIIDEDFDDMFDEMFEAALAEEMQVEIPDPDASWGRMSARIDRQANRKRFKKKLQLVGMMAAAVLLGALIFGSPKQSEAFLPVTKILTGVKDDVISLFHGDRKKLEEEPKGMLTAPPPNQGTGPVMGTDYQEKERITVKSQEEAQKATKTPLPKIHYVPEGYTFEKADLSLDEAGSARSYIVLYMKNGGNEFINLLVTPAIQDSLSSMSVDRSQATTEEIKINSYDGLYITSARKVSSVIWNSALFSFNLKADKLDKPELIKMAESIQ